METADYDEPPYDPDDPWDNASFAIGGPGVVAGRITINNVTTNGARFSVAATGSDLTVDGIRSLNSRNALHVGDDSNSKISNIYQRVSDEEAAKSVAISGNLRGSVRGVDTDARTVFKGDHQDLTISDVTAKAHKAKKVKKARKSARDARKKNR